MESSNKNIFISVVLLLAVIVVIGFLYTRRPAVVPVVVNSNGTTTSTSTVSYSDPSYGFSMALPQSWQGYFVATSTWEGLAVGGSAGEKVITSGPIILIRHPQWTQAVPRQDIPIMIFTIPQWNELQADRFHIGAAPLGPSELGSNAEYVFALPARYNFAYLPGYQEVDQIIHSDAFNAFNPI